MTRDGDLSVDGKGRLVTEMGGIVQPQINVPAGTTDSQISIAGDGTVNVAGQGLGKIALVTVRSPQGLDSVGDNAFVTTAKSGNMTGRAGRHHAQAGRAGRLQRRRLAGDGRHDGRAAHLPADVQGHPDRGPDDGNRQPGEALMQPTIATASLPADVRTGSAQDKKDYKSAQGFEQMLVSQLVQSMVGADGSSGASDTDSDSDSDDGTTSQVSNPLADGPYASQLQDSLTTALTSGSGLGLAAQIYKEMRS